MLSYYMIYYEKFNKIIQLTEKEALRVESELNWSGLWTVPIQTINWGSNIHVQDFYVIQA